MDRNICRLGTIWTTSHYVFLTFFFVLTESGPVVIMLHLIEASVKGQEPVYNFADSAAMLNSAFQLDSFHHLW